MINPKASPRDLEVLMSDRAHWDLFDEVLAHPSCWPALREWIYEAQDHPETAGAPPMAPQPAKTHLAQRLRSLTHREPVLVTSDDHVSSDEIQPPFEAVSSLEDFTVGDDSLSDESDITSGAGASVVTSRHHVVNVRILLIIVAFLVGLVVVGGGFYAWQEHHEAVAVEAATAREEKELSVSVTDAQALLKRVKPELLDEQDSVSRAEDDLSQLIKGTLNPRQSQTIREKTEDLEKLWDTKVEHTKTTHQAALTRLLDEANQLVHAPDSQAKKDLTALIDVWKAKKVNEKTLRQARDAETDLRTLIDTVRQEKQAVEAESQKKQEVAPQQTNPSPRPSVPSLPVTPPIPQHSYPAPNTPPSWSVPAPQGEASLPESLN